MPCMRTKCFLTTFVCECVSYSLQGMIFFIINATMDTDHGKKKGKILMGEFING